jgi:hypothetical protein
VLHVESECIAALFEMMPNMASSGSDHLESGARIARIDFVRRDSFSARQSGTNAVISSKFILFLLVHKTIPESKASE